jgi:hypothetical protein
VIGVVVCVVVFCALLYFVIATNKCIGLFDKQILDISHKREDGIIEEREDGVYMYSNGEWLCLDKKFDAEITYVSSLNKNKIISDFNRGVKFYSMKREVRR